MKCAEIFCLENQVNCPLITQTSSRMLFITGYGTKYINICIGSDTLSLVFISRLLPEILPQEIEKQCANISILCFKQNFFLIDVSWISATAHSDIRKKLYI